MANYLDTPAKKAEVLAAMNARDRGATYIQTASIKTTGLFAHRMVRTLIVHAKRSGLKVTTYDHDGGWFVRRHVLIVEGDPVGVVSFKLLALAYINGEI